MLNCVTELALVPFEYKKSVQGLCPGTASNDSISDFAELLGVGTIFRECLQSETALNDLLIHFQKNTSLLIAKTWVEKGDEFRKSKLDVQIQMLVQRIQQKTFAGAVRIFSDILEELAILFFGSQSKKPDLLEYAFRIDAQLGLFCCYGKIIRKLQKLQPNADPQFLQAMLLLGICYLTNL